MNKDSTQNRSKPLRIVLYIVLLTSIFAYGVGVGKYQWISFSILKNIQDIFDPILYRPLETEELYKSENNNDYTLTTYRYLSQPMTIKGNLEYQTENIYQFERKIIPNKTAIAIMDPWTSDVNSTEIFESHISPLLKLALAKGHPIIVLTSDPRLVRDVKIHHELQTLIDNGLASIVYHESWNDDQFTSFLRSQNINALIYTGVASNACLINRRLGIINMRQHDFKTFYLPKASAAFSSTNDDLFHQKATEMIIRYFAEQISYDNIIKVLSVK